MDFGGGHAADTYVSSYIRHFYGVTLLADARGFGLMALASSPGCSIQGRSVTWSCTAPNGEA